MVSRGALGEMTQGTAIVRLRGGTAKFPNHVFGCCLFFTLLCLSSCRRGAPVIELDRPQLTPQVRALDLTVHSAALGKNMSLRVVLPADKTLASQQLPVVYFLHGAGMNLHDWTNHSNIASFAAEGFILVFVDAPGSYYINDLRSPNNRYESYITQEIPAAVHAALPTVEQSAKRTAIVGISRGGYGAVVLGLKHPDRYSFIGTISGALDLNERHFRWRSPIDSLDVQRAFGSSGSATRRNNDPYELITKVWRNRSPYLFVACGEQDSLFNLSQRLTHQLAAQQLPAESHFASGAHNWQFWSTQLPALEAALQTHLSNASSPKLLVTAGLR